MEANGGDSCGVAQHDVETWSSLWPAGKFECRKFKGFHLSDIQVPIAYARMCFATGRHVQVSYQVQLLESLASSTG